MYIIVSCFCLIISIDFYYQIKRPHIKSTGKIYFRFQFGHLFTSYIVSHTALCNLLKNKGVMERQKICVLFLSLSYVSGFNIGLKGVAVSKGASDSMHGYSLDFATKDNKVWYVNIHTFYQMMIE